MGEYLYSLILRKILLGLTIQEGKYFLAMHGKK